MAALETLAIIAYRQPITGPEIQELRSVSPAGVLKTLLERRLVRIAGRKEIVGKPFVYCTTREFLVHFGLKSLRDLPPLEEFEETFGESAGEPAAVPADPAGSASSAGPEAATAPQEEGAPAAPAPADSEPDREESIMRQAAAIEEAEAEAEPDEVEAR